jgi:hypothetical protein
MTDLPSNPSSSIWHAPGPDYGTALSSITRTAPAAFPSATTFSRACAIRTFLGRAKTEFAWLIAR